MPSASVDAFQNNSAAVGEYTEERRFCGLDGFDANNEVLNAHNKAAKTNLPGRRRNDGRERQQNLLLSIKK